MLAWEEELSKELMNLVNSMKIDSNGEMDRMIWIPESDKEFSVKYLYRQIESTWVQRDHVVDLVWKNAAPLKVKFLGWLVWAGRLKTTEFLVRIKVIDHQSDVRCKFCKEEVEDVDHVMLLCPFIWRVWCSIIHWWGLSWVSPRSISALLHWWKGWRLNKEKRLVWNTIPVAIWWSIWNQRNQLFFNNQRLEWQDLVDLIKMRIIFWVKVKKGLKHYSVNQVAF